MRFRIFLMISSFALCGCNLTANGANNQNSKTTTNSQDFFKIGEAIKIGNVVFKINSAENTKKIGGQYLFEETNNNFVVINLSVKNVGNEELSLTGEMMQLCVGDKVYEAHSSGIYLDDGFYVIQTIGPDITKTINVVYETPSYYTSDYYLQVKPSAYSYSTAKIYLV